MKKENKPGLCPVCGGERKPATTTSPRAVRADVAAVSTAPTIVTYSVGAESSDDETASDIEEFLLKSRSPQLEGK
jgi:hypothetical protein